MKSLKRFMAYFLYVVFVGWFIVWSNAIIIASNKNEMGPMLLILPMLFHIFIGFLLALSRFLSVIQKPGVWKFNWVKLIAIGLPSFLAAGAFPVFWTISFLQKYMPFLFNNSTLSTTGGIVFGYVLLTSFEKGITKPFNPL